MIPFLNQKFFLKSFLKSLFIKDIDSRVKSLLAAHYQEKEVFFTNCAKTALFVILETVKLKSKRRKIILPAYTDSGLVAAIEKANCIPVFCDISFENFNMDIEAAKQAIDNDTLAVIFVYMFGIPKGLESLNNFCEEKGVYLIEDTAQSFGSKYKNNYVGNVASFSFTSLARGKNISTYRGGILFVDKQYSKEIKQSLERINKAPFYEGIKDFFLYLVICALSYPLIYTLFLRITSSFRSQKPVFDFKINQYCNCKKRILYSILVNLDRLLLPKINYGQKLYSTLNKLSDNLILPQITDEMRVCFNRFPLVLKDKTKLALLKDALIKEGIEADLFYGYTLIDIYPQLEKYQSRKEFKNAKLLAENLLVLPVSSYTNEKVIEKINRIFKQLL